MNADSAQDSGETAAANLILLLQEGKMGFDIDLPIDRAFQSFPIPDASLITQREFIDLLSRLVRLIYREGVAVPRDMSASTSRAEALWILQMAFSKAGPDAYDTAWLSAQSSGDGLYFVLWRMAETIKALEREKYRAWVYSSQVGLRSWQERCKIAGALLRHYRHILHPALAAQSPGELADEIQGLFEAIQRGEMELRQTIGSALPPCDI